MDGVSAMMDVMMDQDDAPIEAETPSANGTEPRAGRQTYDRVEPPAADQVDISPRRIIEAIVLASDSPMPAAKLASVLGVGDARDVRRHIAELNEQYAEQQLSFRIEHIAGGYQILTLPAYNTWLAKLLRTRQEAKLSPAALETLAIVAYKQPCTRADIEAVRGVAAGDMLNRLREMNLVKIVGRAEDLGRPMLYGTTKRFLEVFGLSSLEDLPQVEALAGGAAAPAVPESAATAEGESKTNEASITEPDTAQDALAAPVSESQEDRRDSREPDMSSWKTTETTEPQEKAQ